MTEKKLPFSKEQIEEIARKVPTPFHIYHEEGMMKNIRNFYRAFSWNAGFCEYFAVKATPNPFLLKLFAQEGLGMDCSSMAELLLCEAAGVSKERLFFSSNNTPAEEFIKAHRMGAIINLDDISHIDFFEKHVGKLPELLCFRYNPGSQIEGNAIIGDPKESKYGLTEKQLLDAYRIAKEKGVKRFGLHTMLVSNELNIDHLANTAILMFRIALQLYQQLEIVVEFINLGGGIGIPYRPEETVVDMQKLSNRIEEAYVESFSNTPLCKVKIFYEAGRVITGPYGFLVSKVRHLKDTYKKYAGLDACMTDLMRPGMYGSYHHITVLGKEHVPPNQVYDVTGSLCENNDKFAINRKLPSLAIGDTVVIHDAGAHGHAMGFNYNGKLRPAELLLRSSGEVITIRRAETIEDHFATLDFEQLRMFS